MASEKVTITGILTDKSMTVQGTVGKANTVEWAVRKLKPDVARFVSERYDLQPPLDADSMSTKYFPSGAAPADKLETLGTVPFTVLFAPGESQKLAIQARISSYAEARSTNQEMESRFQHLLTTVKNDLNAKMGDMKTRMDEKDGIIEDLKVKVGDMKTRMGDMKTRIDEKDGDIEGLNEKVDGLQEQTVTLRGELKNEKDGRQDDMNALREVTLLLAPLHLRVLLDRARQKILQEFQCKSWEDLRCDRTVHQLVDVIDERLAHVPRHPSRDSIKFMCSYNNVRREGNVAAHSASQDEIREAVTKKALETQERRYLEQIFEFLFDALV